MTMNISRPTPAQIEQMLEFIIRHNQEGETHIGYYGKGETELRETLAEFTRPLEESFLLAWQGEKLVSVFGVDYDPEIGRAWLYGPQVASRDWHAIADEDLRKLQDDEHGQQSANAIPHPKQTRSLAAFFIHSIICDDSSDHGGHGRRTESEQSAEDKERGDTFHIGIIQ